MSELTNALVENQKNLERIGGLLKLRETGSLSKAQIKTMQDEKACPTCGKALRPLEIEHLAGGSTPTSESGGGAGAPGDVKLKESVVKGFMGFGLNREQAERAAAGKQRQV